MEGKVFDGVKMTKKPLEELYDIEFISQGNEFKLGRDFR